MTLTRTEIHSQSVLGDKRIDGAQWDFHLQEDPRIGLFRVTSFGKDTAKELEKAIKEGDFKAIILDLRNNPGGVLFGAIDICSLFIDSGVVVSTRGRDGTPKEVFEASGDMKVDPTIPMAVLVNHYSASASEIVSACLQDYERAVVIGERTWGKGTVQNVIKLEGGRNAVNLTTSSYWRPSNKNIHRKKNATESDEWGVSPNSGFEVKLTDEEFEKVVRDRLRRDAYRPYEDEKPPEKPAHEANGEKLKEKDDNQPFDDPQLRKAIIHLREKLAK
jgi:carboxyl-terminal processing protease